MDINERTIKSIASIAAAEVLQAMGLSSGEISRNRAIKVYGSWFKEAEEAGRIRPVRIGPGKTGTKHYAVQDILAVKAMDLRKAEIQINNL